ncbi:hypothetical protein AGOR_G00140910 [Albula goreensis]|uniref:Insulin-like domain-containing protein n=1 Tax=Albula goreensis TaxID=1534307 RepID=A0A8T3DA43_9TELE|nr:hypothetical protein AGOR_G00140910 [Albula goreensis]
MPSSDHSMLCQASSTHSLQVCWWRSVCILYPLLCLAALPYRAESVKARCGRELVADLEFVCGDRGFYRGKVAGGRGGPRLKGKGIVEQCCLRGCDLQHLEAYCAKPRRSRRHVPSHAPPPSTEELFRVVFRKRILDLHRLTGPRTASLSWTALGPGLQTGPGPWRPPGATFLREEHRNWKAAPSEQ